MYIGHRKSATSDLAGTSANRHQQIADVNVVKNNSVVTTTELSLPLWWLAIQSNLTVFSAVFLGAVS